MNQKIKIMNPQPQIPDEEMKGYMDFEQLLQKRTMILKRQKMFFNSGLAIVALTSVILMFYYFNHTNSNNAEQNSLDDRQIPSANHEAGVLKDSASEKKEIERPITPPLSGEKTGVKPRQKDANETVKIGPDRDVQTKKEIDAQVEQVYIQAEPVHGYPDLFDYFNKNLRYPQEALKDSIQGILTISFIINLDGSADHIEVTNTLGEPFEKVAIELIRKMPQWKPATLNGKPVKSKVSLPLTFEFKKVASDAH